MTGLTTPISRRRLMSLASTGAVGCALNPTWVAQAKTAVPRYRVIIDNDFSGDPDGLFQLAHHLLSPSVEIPLVIGSHLHADDFWDRSNKQAANGSEKARELIQLLKLATQPQVVAGSEEAIKADGRAAASKATQAIINEALRSDTKLPLFYAAGAGLTELALAWRADRTIGQKLRLVWIGGGEHAGTQAPPGRLEPEYNLTIDTEAARIIFNESDIEIWQVPRPAYRQMLFGFAELDDLAESSEVGAYLKRQIERVIEMGEQAPPQYRQNIGETYILGDSPLVTLTALQSSFQADPSSSSYVVGPTPKLTSDGAYEPNPSGRPMRIYTSIDTRLSFVDMFRKVRTGSKR